MVNDDSWSRCTTALRRTQQHANSSPLMWLCGDAREAGPDEKCREKTFPLTRSLLLAQFPTLHDHSGGRVRGARKIRFDRVLCDVPCSGMVPMATMRVQFIALHCMYLLCTS